MTILVVEDDAAIREMVLDLLQGEGYAVRGVANGHEAIDVLWQNTAHIRLILLDLMMPMMSGWEFRLRQMAHPRWSEIPVVILSATTELSEHAILLRVTDFLPKPIDSEKLIEIVQRYCRVP